MVALRIKAITIRVTILTQVIENLFQFESIAPRGGEAGKVEQGTKAAVKVELLVSHLAQVVGAIVCHIVSTKEIVFHVVQCAVLLCEIDAGHECPCLPFVCTPSLRCACRSTDVPDRRR